MYLNSCFEPPIAVQVVEVVQVACTRGAGPAQRNVTQIWTKSGHLIAEHDHIHDDPVYASHFLRKHIICTAAGATENVAEQGAA